MKNIILNIGSFFLLLPALFAQSEEKPDAKQATSEKSRKAPASMRLWDINLTAGGAKVTDHTSGSGFSTTDINNGLFFLFHFQESMLSNYVWAAEPDKKIKFGFQETIDMGWIQGSQSSSTTAFGKTETNTQKANMFLFNYEAGLAVVYKINERMDAGFTYYPFALTSVNRKYAKFRFRYSHIMGEFSAFGKTAIELKYLKSIGPRNLTGDTYFGIGFGNCYGLTAHGNGAYFLQANIGIVF